MISAISSAQTNPDSRPKTNRDPLLLFDRKFGKDFISSVPGAPGVYSFKDEEGKILYVGKAKNLRRRLSQYRRARSGKMRKIVKAATLLAWNPCDTELDACLLELRHIQEDSPRLNVAGRFSYRYPLIGLSQRGNELHLCFTTTPAVFPHYQFYGAYRSRFITAEAFFGMIRLMQFIGHPVPRKAEDRKAYSYEFGLRRLPGDWPARLDAFLRGRSSDFLETLLLKLLENAGARAKRDEVQEAIDALSTFWRDECLKLAAAIDRVGYQEFPVPQTQRDPLFVRAGFEKEDA